MANSELYGLDYGMGLFKPKACDYCDDVMNETADISIGDAWLPQYVKDTLGTSIVIARNPLLHQILVEGIEDSRIKLDRISSASAIASQTSGLRHRREGLSFRLANKTEKDEWLPPKRVRPGQFHISPKRKQIYSLREQISEKSHEAFLLALEKRDFDVFVKAMDPLISRYQRIVKNSIWVRGLRKLKKLIFTQRWSV
jgi:hypothetical protein